MFKRLSLHKNRYLAGIAFGMVVLLTTTACGSFLVRSGDDDVISGVDLIKQRKIEIINEVSIGEVAKVRDLNVSVMAVRVTDGRSDRTAAPVAAGQIYLLADVLMENVGGKQAFISSRMQIALVNSAGEIQDWAFFPTSGGSIDGRIDPGRERKGELAWVVDDDANGLMMMFGGTAFVLGDVSGYRSGSPEIQITSVRQ